MFPDLMDDLSNEVLEDWIAYLKEPSLASFLLVHGAVARSQAYDTSSRAVETIEHALLAGDIRDALTQIKAAMPNYLLTPRLHNMASTALLGIGDTSRSDFERQVFLLVRETSVQTGDGTKEHPYLALHSYDASDMLEYLETPVSEQRFEERSGKFYVACEGYDDSQIWFEVRMGDKTDKTRE